MQAHREPWEVTGWLLVLSSLYNTSNCNDSSSYGISIATRTIFRHYRGLTRPRGQTPKPWRAEILDSPSSFKIIKHPISFHIIRILHATPATKAAEYFRLGFEQRERPFRAVGNHVLTAICRLQVTGTNLPECGTISLLLNTTQLPGRVPPAAPYSLIAYPVQGLPSAYPLSLTGATASWTVNYPAGEPRFTWAPCDCDLGASASHHC